jgi:HlyD family secretion protein
MSRTDPRPQKRSWWLPLGLLLTMLGGAVFLMLSGPADKAPAVAAVAAAPADRQVRALGQVEPYGGLLTVAAPTGADAGRVADIRVVEGAMVQKGDVLAVMDTEPALAAQLAQAEANLSVKRAALAALAADLQSAGTKLAAQVEEQRVALARAEADLDQRTQLRDRGLYEDRALDDLRLDVEAARYSLRTTEIDLARNAERDVTGQRLDEVSAAAELTAAIAARDKAATDHAMTFVRAPITGRVLDIQARLGEQIGNDGFATMGDTAQMVVRAEVFESDVRHLQIGQAVRADSRSLDQPLTGTVTQLGVKIAAQTILSNDPADVVDARVVEVYVTLDPASSQAVANLSNLQVTASFLLGDGDA